MMSLVMLPSAAMVSLLKPAELNRPHRQVAKTLAPETSQVNEVDAGVTFLSVRRRARDMEL